MNNTAVTPTVPPTGDTSTPSPDKHPAPHSYFNRAQLEDLDLADEIYRQAIKAPYDTALASRDLDQPWFVAYGQAIADARTKTTATGQSGENRKAAAVNAGDNERNLLRQLQSIQSAARQKHRMLDLDDDPTTNFPLDGYLIGQRLNTSRAALLQNAASLIAKAEADRLPGYRTAEALAAVRVPLQTYTQAETHQATTMETAGADRAARDKLIRNLNTRRQAVQCAIDGLYSYLDDANAVTRRAFKLQPNRPFHS